MSTLTTTDHTVAAIAAVQAALSPYSWTAYRADDVSHLPTKPACYLEVSCERRYNADPYVSPGTSMRLWRIVCRWVADYTANADLLEAACWSALENVRLAVGAGTTTPIQHEVTEPTVQDDDSTWSGYVEFTYAVVG